MVGQQTFNLWTGVRFSLAWFLQCKFSASSLLPFAQEKTRGKFLRVGIRRVYVLASWLAYLSGVSSNSNELRVAIWSSRKLKFTLTRAPMAHKTWSREQFGWNAFELRFFCSIELNSPLTEVPALWVLLTAGRDFSKIGFGSLFSKNATVTSNVLFKFLPEWWNW